MRKPRRESIRSTGLVHKMWRGHNREPVFEADTDKRAYLRCLAKTFTGRVAELLALFSYCLMTNHTHESLGASSPCSVDDLPELIEALSTWMRNGHSRFGAEFNRRHRRQGKVAYDRPKTKEIDSEQGVLEAMFYGDANPVRAGMVSHPSRYRWSSYRFYAYGEQTEETELLTPPAAYLALGETPEARQRKYRSLVDDYLRRAGLLDDRPSELVDEPSAELTERAAGEGDELARARGPDAHLPPS